MLNQNLQTSYLLNADDVLIAVGTRWDEFAADNQGCSSTSKYVLNRVIWDFVQGETVRAELKNLFQKCRSQDREVETYYRCDSEAVQRFFKMRLSSHGDGYLLVEHLLLRETAHARSIPKIEHSRVLKLQSCSICCAVELDGRWTEARLSKTLQRSDISYTICSVCAEQLRSVTQAPKDNVINLPFH